MCPELSEEILRKEKIGNFFRPNQLKRMGISFYRLRQLERQGVVEQIGYGLYRLVEAELTEHHSIASVCARVPDAVICLLTALAVHEIGTQIPHEIWFAVPHRGNAPAIGHVRTRMTRFSGHALTCGVEETTFDNVPARITTLARTVVDCFRYERMFGREVAIEALRESVQEGKTSVAEIARVNKCLPSRRLSAFLELVYSVQDSCSFQE